MYKKLLFIKLFLIKQMKYTVNTKYKKLKLIRIFKTVFK